MSDDIATELIAKYAVLGPRVELERTLPLEPGESVIVGVIAHTKFGGNPLYGSRRGFLRLSNRRLCIVRHYGFIRDRIIVIPPGAITAVERGGPAQSVHITFRVDEGERVITIVNWREPQAPIDHNLGLGESPPVDEMLREVVIALVPVPSNRG